MAYNDFIGRSDTGNMIPPEYADEIIESTKENSVVLGMARRLRDMQRHEMKLTVEDALPMAYFVNGDNGTKGVTKSVWNGVTITKQKILMKEPKV